MEYSELEFRRMLRVGIDNIEDEIMCNILGYIGTIHANNQDFVDSHFDQTRYLSNESTACVV